MADLEQQRFFKKALIVLSAVTVVVVIGIVAVIMFNRTLLHIPSSVDKVSVSTYSTLPNDNGSNKIYTDKATVAKYRDWVNGITIVGKEKFLTGCSAIVFTFFEQNKEVKSLSVCGDQVTVDGKTHTFTHQ